MMVFKKNKWKNRSGFTLFETLLVFGVIAIISVVGITNLVSRKSRFEFDDVARRMAAFLRDAQNRSVAQEGGVIWGVHFDNGTSTTPFYALFKNSYSSTSTVNRQILPNNVRFASSSIASGSFLEITFGKISGIPSTSTSIGLELTSGGGGVAPDSLGRTQSGKIFFDDFNRSNL